jgi:hemerythrin
MRDYAECQAYMTHLRHEHQRLNRALREVDLRLDACRLPQDTGEILRQLRLLRQAIADHFHEEEVGGCLEEAISYCPSKSREMNTLERQHTRLLQMLDMLIDQVSHGEADGFAEKFRRFLQRMRAHEATENRVLQEAFGTGD